MNSCCNTPVEYRFIYHTFFRFQSIEVVKRELSKIIVKGETSNGFDGAGPSSSSSTSNGTSSSAAKPTDITHLIKRKKPDSATTEVEGSPAKKTAVELDKSSDWGVTTGYAYFTYISVSFFVIVLYSQLSRNYLLFIF